MLECFVVGFLLDFGDDEKKNLTLKKRGALYRWILLKEYASATMFSSY